MARRSGIIFGGENPTTSIENIREYLNLNRDDFRVRSHFRIRIEDLLLLNINARPAWARGFESKPAEIIKRTMRPEFDSPYVMTFHASQAVVFISYLKMINRNGFGVVIYDRMLDVEKPLPVVFGMTASYNRNSECMIRRLHVPRFSEARDVTGMRDIPVTEQNIILAMTYGRLCADQVYNKEFLTPRTNWNEAVALCGPENPRKKDKTTPPRPQ